jgi:hypothetical protein
MFIGLADPRTLIKLAIITVIAIVLVIALRWRSRA